MPRTTNPNRMGKKGRSPLVTRPHECMTPEEQELYEQEQLEKEEREQKIKELLGRKFTASSVRQGRRVVQFGKRSYGKGLTNRFSALADTPGKNKGFAKYLLCVREMSVREVRDFFLKHAPDMKRLTSTTVLRKIRDLKENDGHYFTPNMTPAEIAEPILRELGY